MDEIEEQLSPRHKQVLDLEKLRRSRKYKEGWLYHLCRQKGLLSELQDLQFAGMVGELADTEGGYRSPGLLTLEALDDNNGGVPLSPRTRLTVELVPSTSWFTNLRSELSKDDWDRLRSTVYERAGNRCEICGGRGLRHPVECHEIWFYDDQNRVQRLDGLIALCPACHEAKHMGYASSIGRGAQARAHLGRINGWSMDDVELYLETQFEQWSRRSQHQWTLDLSWLNQHNIEIAPVKPQARS